MKPYRWNKEKSDKLRRERGVGFEEIQKRLSEGSLIDLISHPNPGKYPNQKVMVVEFEGYVCMVPFVESGEEIFLKTIIPSRRLHKRYRGRG